MSCFFTFNVLFFERATDMKRNASNVVEDFMTSIFGEDLTPWQTEEKKEKEQ